MTEIRRSLPLLGLALAAATIAGCAASAAPQPALQPAAVAPAAPPPPDEWNVFPDPITGHVEVYHNGVDVGSITGDEKEDPPVPRPRKEDDLDRSP